MLRRILSQENHVDRAISFGERNLVLFSKQFTLKLPLNTGFSWKRPSAVWMQFPDGREQVWKIVDPTRSTIFLLIGFVIAGTVLLGMLQISTGKPSE
jgi:hypothetical protein